MKLIEPIRSSSYNLVWHSDWQDEEVDRREDRYVQP